MHKSVPFILFLLLAAPSIEADIGKEDPNLTAERAFHRDQGDYRDNDKQTLFEEEQENRWKEERTQEVHANEHGCPSGGCESPFHHGHGCPNGGCESPFHHGPRYMHDGHEFPPSSEYDFPP